MHTPRIDNRHRTHKPHNRLRKAIVNHARAEVGPGKKKPPPEAGVLPSESNSDAVVEVVFHRVSSHAQHGYFFHFEADIRIDAVIGEYPAGLEKVSIGVQ